MCIPLKIIKSSDDKMKIDVMVADKRHFCYAQEICDEVYVSAQERGTGIAKRTP